MCWQNFQKNWKLRKMHWQYIWQTEKSKNVLWDISKNKKFKNCPDKFSKKNRKLRKTYWQVYQKIESFGKCTGRHFKIYIFLNLANL